MKRIFIEDEICERSISMLKWQFSELEDKEPIEIVIDSEGGDVFSGNSIYSLIEMEAANRTVYGAIIGKCMSMATVIASAIPKGNLSIAKNATYMIHDVAGYMQVKLGSIDSIKQMLEVANNTIITCLADRTGQSREAIKAAYFDGKDHYLSADDCLSLGFCDSIWRANLHTAEPVESAIEMPENEIEIELELELDGKYQAVPNPNYFAKLYNSAKEKFNQFSKPQNPIPMEATVKKEPDQKDAGVVAKTASLFSPNTEDQIRAEAKLLENKLESLNGMLKDSEVRLQNAKEYYEREISAKDKTLSDLRAELTIEKGRNAENAQRLVDLGEMNFLVRVLGKSLASAGVDKTDEEIIAIANNIKGKFILSNAGEKKVVIDSIMGKNTNFDNVEEAINDYVINFHVPIAQRGTGFIHSTTFANANPINNAKKEDEKWALVSKLARERNLVAGNNQKYRELLEEVGLPVSFK